MYHGEKEKRSGMILKDSNKTALFETMAIPKAVMQLAIPTVLGSLVMVLYNLADTYFVGMLNDPIQNAAVTLAAPVLLAFNAINNLFGVGSSSMMSRALGRKDFEEVRRSSAFGFYCALFSGVLFSLLAFGFQKPLLVMLGADQQTMTETGKYLFWTVICGATPAILNVVLAYMIRSEGASLHASIGTMSGCILNMILDPIFIMPWGFDMGAAGAGCATFLSNCAACGYFFVLQWHRRKSTYATLSPKWFSFRKAIVLGICAVGIPACIQNLLNVTGMTILNNFTSQYGADAVAAMGISQKMNMVPLQIALGFSQGIMPLVSYNYGSGNIARMKQAILFTLKVLMPLLLVVMGGYYFGAGSIVGAFMNNESIIAYGTRFLRGMSLALPFICLDFTTVGVFQALGMGRAALCFAILRKIVLEIPALFILNHLFPLYGLAFAQPAAEFVLAVAAVVMLSRIFKHLSVKKTW